MDNFDDKYQKKNPFNVPEGYFENLTDRIMDRLDEKPQRVRFIQLVKPYLSLVAIFVIAFVVIQAIFPLLVDKNQMLIKEGEQVSQQKETKVEDPAIWDSQFNPTSEEIIEYLATEVDNSELIYAGIY